MDLNLSQTLKQEQILSPQMLQYMALLPMPIMELKEHIAKEIEENPALEIPLEDFSGVTDPDKKQEMIENTSAVCESLDEHLLKQLVETETSDTTREICELLIGNLDANGFFEEPVESLLENRNFTDEDISTALAIVQSFDPYGICVADFRESLVLQAKLSGMQERDLKIFKALVYDHLENINAGRYNETAAALHIDSEELEAFVSILKTFTPFPGRLYDNSAESFIEPEFSIHNIEGSLVLEMNKSTIPTLEISSDFQHLKTINDKEASLYISEQLKRARTLISQLDLRYKTIYSAATALLELQEDFFYNGPQSLKTLNMKTVADKIGVHETTISRLAQNKWVETDWGLFQLKYFFSQGVSDISRTAIKEMIAALLKENPKLSDQKISDILLGKNIKCARRTVSKYRSEMN